MINELDCRGMSCPDPVLNVRNLLEKVATDSVSVLVDNEAARQNVSRFLEYKNFKVSFCKSSDGFQVVGTREEGAEAFEIPHVIDNLKGSRHRSKKIMVLIKSVNMGHGDDSLGDMLMFNYIKTLKEMGPDLWRVVFVNSGVSFTAEGSETVPILQELSSIGVQISACGACLAFFHILDKLRVGDVTNMLEIVTAMKEADSVISV